MEKRFFYLWEVEMNNIKIEVISPVHVGDNENKNLSSLSDFIVENTKIKIIDHKKLENIFFENPHIMEDYIKEVKKHSGTSFSIKSFLIKHKIAFNEITSEESIPLYGNFGGKEIHSFISENGKKYLPGSSIKGAIRNALAYVFLNKHLEMIRALENKHFEPKSKPNFSYEDIQIFGKDPLNDILKFLQISDSASFSKNSIAIYSCKNYHLKKQKLDNNIPINYECILPDSETKLKIKIKENIPIEKLQIRDKSFWNEHLSITKIFEALNTLSQKFIEREIGELSNVKEMQQTIVFYNNLLNEIKNSNNKSGYFCLGKGTTIMEKTILLALSKEELHNLRNKMENTKAYKNFGWIKDKRTGKKVLPERLPITRLVYQIQNNLQAGFGWLKMEKI